MEMPFKVVRKVQCNIYECADLRKSKLLQVDGFIFMFLESGWKVPRRKTKLITTSSSSVRTGRDGG
jgi:hypothetical protein